MVRSGIRHGSLRHRAASATSPTRRTGRRAHRIGWKEFGVGPMGVGGQVPRVVHPCHPSLGSEFAAAYCRSLDAIARNVFTRRRALDETYWRWPPPHGDVHLVAEGGIHYQVEMQTHNAIVSRIERVLRV